MYLSENPNSSFLQETDEDHALLCEEEVALDLEVGRLNRDGTPRMFPACSKPKRNIAKGTTDPRVEFILQVLHKS